MSRPAPLERRSNAGYPRPVQGPGAGRGTDTALPVLPEEADAPADVADAAELEPPRAPLYPRVLRLRHVHPNAWQRAVLWEGSVVAGCVLVLADVASAWTLPLLPVGVAAVVKAHDVLAGVLATRPAPADAGTPHNGDGAAPGGDGADGRS